MSFDCSKLDIVRDTKLELHCLSVRIWQNKENGLQLEGYGIVKQNKSGMLYLEFICTKTVYEAHHNDDLVIKVPFDHLNPNEKLFAELIDIKGTIWKSSGFKLSLSRFHLHEKKVIHIPFSRIESEEERTADITESYMYLEFAEPIDIPFNISNSATSSSTGSESCKFNEQRIELDKFTVRIVDEPECRFIKIHGDFSPHDVEQCLKFFLGFSCGILPQPYVIFTNIGSKNHQCILSINNQLTHRRSTNPIPSNVRYSNKSQAYSSDLFQKIIILHHENIDFFNCIYSQWERTWHGFNSTNNISELVLSIAIEGILNDIYIPTFKVTKIDLELESAISKIKEQLNDLDIENEYLTRLKSSVSYWKNITATKSLNILIHEDILDENDTKIWNKIRNASAHPKIKELNTSEEQQKREKVLVCLNIFHKLVLNVIGYTGPLNIFSGDTPEFIEIQHKNILT